LKKYFVLALLFLLASTLFLLAATVFGQDFDYGEVSELKGVKKIYIYTGSDLKSREKIIKKINKKLPDLTIVNLAEAEVALAYGSDTSTFLTSINSTSTSQSSGNVSATGNTGTYSRTSTTQTSSTPVYREKIYAEGLVIKFIPGSSRARYLMDFKDSKTYLVERNPSTNFARAFVKAYQKANGMK
jgi:hypothetical protein